MFNFPNEIFVSRPGASKCVQIAFDLLFVSHSFRQRFLPTILGERRGEISTGFSGQHTVSYTNQPPTRHRTNTGSPPHSPSHTFHTAQISHTLLDQTNELFSNQTFNLEKIIFKDNRNFTQIIWDILCMILIDWHQSLQNNFWVSQYPWSELLIS